MTATVKGVGSRDKENKNVLAAKEALKEGGVTTPVIKIGLEDSTLQTQHQSRQSLVAGNLE